MLISLGIITAFTVACLLVGSLVRALKMKSRGTRPAVTLKLVHSINDDRCTGCDACVTVCPTDVLDLVKNKSRVLRFDDCIQCAQCEIVCPTTALVMHRIGSEPPPVRVPLLDEYYRAAPGLYLIGEAGGKPLVKNASNLGRAAIEHLWSLGVRPAQAGSDVDVVIVGSGPGGLSAALSCIARGLSYVVLEKDEMIASTIANYPKGKLVMAEPYDVRCLGLLPVWDSEKEEIIAAWAQLLDEKGVRVQTRQTVEEIVREEDGRFRVSLTGGAIQHGRAVVLAIGSRGKPRRLGVPGEYLPHVTSLLRDADEHSGQSVLVVGGGDSAVEAACALADAGAQVSLSYRGKALSRCKAANRQRLETHIKQRRIRALFQSHVEEIRERTALLRVDSGKREVAAERVFVCIGGDAPVKWLMKVGVQFGDQPHLESRSPTDVLVESLLGKPPSHRPGAPLLRVALAIGALLFGAQADGRELTARAQLLVRKAPSERSPIVDRVAEGVKLTVLGRSPDHAWYHVRSAHGEGWALVRLFRLDEGGEAGASGSETPDEAPLVPAKRVEPKAWVSSSQYHTVPPSVVVQDAPLLERPAKGAGVLGRARRGDRVPIVRRSADGKWCLVDMGGGESAWLVAEAVGDFAPKQTPDRETSPSRSSAPVARSSPPASRPSSADETAAVVETRPHVARSTQFDLGVTGGLAFLTRRSSTNGQGPLANYDLSLTAGAIGLAGTVEQAVARHLRLGVAAGYLFTAGGSTRYRSGTASSTVSGLQVHDLDAEAIATLHWNVAGGLNLRLSVGGTLSATLIDNGAAGALPSDRLLGVTVGAELALPQLVALGAHHLGLRAFGRALAYGQRTENVDEGGDTGTFGGTFGASLAVDVWQSPSQGQLLFGAGYSYSIALTSYRGSSHGADFGATRHLASFALSYALR